MPQIHQWLLSLGVVVCFASVTAAQPVMDPTAVEFTASTDHDVQDAGVPRVLSYELRLFAAGSSSPLRAVNLGKPAPDANRTIRLALNTLLNPLPPGGTTYEVRIAAVGAGGLAESTPSNSFTFQVTCTYIVSPGSRSIGAAGAASTFSVTAPAGCGWTATENSSWISITGGASGSGDGTVSFTVDSNSATSTRTASLTIAGQTRSVDQAGAAGCTYTVSPGSRSVGSAGGASTFSVTTPAGCNWTVTESASWITLTSAASGAGNGTVAFTVAANTATMTRNTTMTIAGQTRNVSQTGVSCAYTVTPTSQAVVRAGGNVVFAVSSAAGCSWSASEQSSWLSIASGASGTGSGTVTIAVSANSGTQSRTASATVAGRTVSVSQSVGVTPAAPGGFRIVRSP